MNLRNVSVFHMFRCFSKNTKVAASLRENANGTKARWHDTLFLLKTLELPNKVCIFASEIE